MVNFFKDNKDKKEDKPKGIIGVIAKAAENRGPTAQEIIDERYEHHKKIAEDNKAENTEDLNNTEEVKKAARAEIVTSDNDKDKKVFPTENQENKKLVKEQGEKKIKSLKKAKKLSEVKNWYKDRYQVVVIQRNVLFVITALALFGLGFSVTAVATLNASKIFEPFVIEHDSKSGVITQVTSKSKEIYTSEASLINYFLVKYIRSRESYDVNDYEYKFSQVVRVLSDANVFRKFRSTIATSNIDSPVNLGRKATREAKITSIVFLEDKRVQVRVAVKEYLQPSYKLIKTNYYILTVSFDFLDLELAPNERYINPLGFQVIGYRKDREERL